MRHVVSPLASSTHETPSLRESGEQDQRQENEPHVHTAATDAHDYAGNKSHLSLSQQLLVGHKIRSAIAKDSLKRPGTKGIQTPSQIPGQIPNLTSIEQEWKHHGPDDLDFRPPTQVPTVPHPMIQ